MGHVLRVERKFSTGLTANYWEWKDQTDICVFSTDTSALFSQSVSFNQENEGEDPGISNQGARMKVMPENTGDVVLCSPVHTVRLLRQHTGLLITALPQL